LRKRQEVKKQRQRGLWIFKLVREAEFLSVKNKFSCSLFRADVTDFFFKELNLKPAKRQQGGVNEKGFSIYLGCKKIQRKSQSA
jgi:hypothetical protein